MLLWRRGLRTFFRRRRLETATEGRRPYFHEASAKAEGPFEGVHGAALHRKDLAPETCVRVVFPLESSAS